MSFKLFFWKKGNANEILLRFQLIAKSIKKLSDIKSKKEKTNEIIEYVKSKLKEAKDEISERAKIEETKPWLTAEQDQEIEDLAEKEISALDELNSNLEEYKELINSAITRQEIDEILAIMESEEKEIKKREKETITKIQEMEKKTIGSRLDRPSVQVPNLKTSDGVKWSKVVIVARQLGGVVIKTRGNHPYEIIFPNQDRPIPLSKDVNTISLAKEIRIQLFKSIPEHKIPKMTKLRQAINSGDVHKLELD